MTKDFIICVFHGDVWLLRASEPLAFYIDMNSSRGSGVGRIMIPIERVDLNRREGHQLTQQRDDPPIEVHLHAPSIISLQQHDRDAARDHRPKGFTLRRIQFVRSEELIPVPQRWIQKEMERTARDALSDSPDSRPITLFPGQQWLSPRRTSTQYFAAAARVQTPYVQP